ncbi:glycosyl hydrolase family 8 [Sporosarcina siberiensis]|uniref:Glycosyl hydrolase family 8 n=1 Tax=Sporosarcina siberiensis TaxID=1365606 RepID=A0ABW4SEV3_9BACL
MIYKNNEDQKEIADTEAFIGKWLTNKNGTLSTYIKEGDKVDSEFVKGRETLSESIGIWMEYLIVKDDQIKFEKAYTVFMNNFFEKDGFIRWKLTETGDSKASANALVDDLRILEALFAASERWDDQRYEKSAKSISNFLMNFNEKENVLTDYYVKGGGAGPYITLSYIEPKALSRLDTLGLIDKVIYENMLSILANAQLDGSFFPKAFDVDKGIYLYDTKVNMIDQALVALYRSKEDYSTKEFLNFIKNEIEVQEKVYGQYDRKTGKAVVKYESPSVYGWLILYCLEVKEYPLAQQLYERMIHFKSKEPEYTGGYSVNDDNTHIFDNLVPLLAEIEMIQLKLIK